MSFFDRKEEVYDLQLTSYGKFLYSIGKLKPAYYSFFDNDINYKISNEYQNDVEPRIQELTPYTKPQIHFEGIEKNINSFKNITSNVYNFKYEPVLYEQEMLSNLVYPLGTSEHGNKNKPAWNFKLLKGAISSSVSSYTSSNGNEIKIPQINCNVDYFTYILTNKLPFDTLNDFVVDEFTNINTINTQAGLVNNFDEFEISNPYEDKTRIFVEGKYLVIDLREINSNILNDNFEIEIYKQELNESGETIYSPLAFEKQNEFIVDELLVDRQENVFTPSTKENVEYYFDIRFDNDIENEIICEIITPTIEPEDKNIYANLMECR